VSNPLETAEVGGGLVRQLDEPFYWEALGGVGHHPLLHRRDVQHRGQAAARAAVMAALVVEQADGHSAPLGGN